MERKYEMCTLYKKYTLGDLEDARKELKLRQEHRDNTNSNNPNAHKGEVRAAALKVRMIEGILKGQGDIELTEEEKINRELDALHPNARSKSIKKYKGERYQIQYSPAAFSRSGKVKEWDHKWVCLDKKNKKSVA